MDYPRRAPKLKKRAPGGGGAGDRGELRLAELSTPRGGNVACRMRPFSGLVFADDWREGRPERGRLH